MSSSSAPQPAPPLPPNTHHTAAELPSRSQQSAEPFPSTSSYSSGRRRREIGTLGELPNSKRASTRASTAAAVTLTFPTCQFVSGKVCAAPALNMEGKTPVYRVPHRPSIIRTSVNTLISVFCTPGAAARGVTFTVSGSILGGLTADALWTHCTDDSTRASREAGEEKPDTAGTTPHTAGRKLESVGYYVANDERETIVRKHYPFYTIVGKYTTSGVVGRKLELIGTTSLTTGGKPLSASTTPSTLWWERGWDPKSEGLVYL